MDQRYKNMMVVFELNSSMKYLKHGLAEIQKISASNDFYESVLLFLSSGLERLFKLMLCLNFKDEFSRFPSYEELMQKNNGHDIELLKKRVEKICIPISTPLFLKDDYDIITNDETINQICKILSEFGKKGRYFNLDVVLGTQQEFEPKAEWEKIENKILIDYYGETSFYEKLSTNQLDELYGKSNELLVRRIELFLRAITRQFIFGNFSKDSKMYVFEIDLFSDIDDKNIGKRNYND